MLRRSKTQSKVPTQYGARLPAGHSRYSDPWPQSTLARLAAATFAPKLLQLYGEGRNQTTIAPKSSFSTSAGNNSLLQMGSSSCTLTSPCTGIVISEVWVQGSTSLAVPPDGIDNSYAGEFSYVEHVTITNFVGNGLLVEGSVAGSSDLADGSGPYVDLVISNVTTGDTSSAVSTTSCINLQAQTRGVHGLTCTANGMPMAGIYLDGSGNTIEDIHFEGVVAGVLAGSQHTAAGNSVTNVSGVDGGNSGPVTYDVQISSNVTAGVANVSDLTLTGISPYGTIKDFTVQDELTGINVPKTDNVTIYALGAPFGGGNGYTLFSTSPVTPSTSVPTNGVPTWGIGTTNIGGESCNTPGALYSNTSGATGTTIFVCTQTTGSALWTSLP
jgi:hypothetical protein